MGVPEDWLNGTRMCRAFFLLSHSEDTGRRQLLSTSDTTSENRRWEVRLARLRLGYTRMTHGYLMSQGGERPVCEECTDEARLTVKHVLVECRSYSSHRRRAFGREQVSLRKILNEGDTSFGGSLYKYVNDIGIYGLI